MPRACTVCARPDAGTINALLGEGRSARSVAVGLGISEDALQRHAQRHAQRHVNGRRMGPPQAPTGQATRPGTPVETTDPLAELVDALRDQALAGNPAIVHQYRLALSAQQAAGNAAPPVRDLAAEPEWIALRGRLLDALAPFPDARLAVAAAIGDL